VWWDVWDMMGTSGWVGKYGVWWGILSILGIMEYSGRYEFLWDTWNRV